MYVCINIEGQITKFILLLFFFFQKKRIMELSFSKKWDKRFKLYLYIKRDFWVGLAQL